MRKSFIGHISTRPVLTPLHHFCPGHISARPVLTILHHFCPGHISTRQVLTPLHQCSRTCMIYLLILFIAFRSILEVLPTSSLLKSWQPWLLAPVATPMVATPMVAMAAPVVTLVSTAASTVQWTAHQY